VCGCARGRAVEENEARLGAFLGDVAAHAL
jgi:hypothetical protein